MVKGDDVPAEQQQQEEMGVDQLGTLFATTCSMEAPTLEMRETEDLVQKAALHIRQAQGMRQFANLKVEQAQRHMDEGLEHCDAHRCLVMDYAQNGQVPFLGNVQPGATYYYTPLRINIFGLVDPAMDKGTGHLDAYVYDERQGGKGGDNVASMVMLYLKKKGWLRDERGKELTIITNNCTGQNKVRR